MNFEEILAAFKSKEESETENIAPLVENRALIDALIAWKSVRITRLKESTCPAIMESDQWEWLWKNINFDLNSFAGVAGTRYQDASNLFNRLKGLRLIYPDGTINRVAKQYLQSVIVKILRKKDHQVPKKD